MKHIDENTWPRKALCDFFAHAANPVYSVTFPLDVGALHAFVKREGLSFYHTMIWVCLRALHRVDAFLYKLRPDGVVLHAFLSPSFTYPIEGDLFGILNMDFDPDEGVRAFCLRAAQLQAAQTEPLPSAMEEERDDLVYISCLPWFTYFHVTQEQSGNPNDSVPRLMWGKFEQRDGRLLMPLTVQVNHRLIDGVHIARLKEEMDDEIEVIGNKE